MIIRLTQKLAKKIDSLDALNDLPIDSNPYLDWSANLFRSERLQYILITNSTSLYSMIMYGRGITDHSDFIREAHRTFHHFMEYDGTGSLYDRYIESDESPMVFAKSLNRSVLGSMNDFIYQTKYHMEVDEQTPFDASCRLNDMPMRYIDMEIPKTAFCNMSKNQDFKI